MMGRREAVARGLRAMEEESHGGRRGLSLRAARAREAEETRGGRMGMGGGGRRRPLQAVVRRAAAGRHGGPWSVLALLPSCAACASRERVRPAAWRRRGVALSRPDLSTLVRVEGKCVVRGCVARVRLSRARARGWEGARCCRARCGAACGTHPCRAPPSLQRRKRNAQVPREGELFRGAEGGRRRRREARRDDEKGGGALFGLRPQ